MPKPKKIYQSSLTTIPSKSGAERPFFPIPNLSDMARAFSQDYEQDADSFTALALNTPSPDKAGYYLESESEATDIGGNNLHWTRGYYQVPPSWDDWQMFTYTFPEYPGATYETFRDPLTQTVLSRLHYDYFVADPNNLCAGLLDASGNAIKTVTSVGKIPTIPKLQYIGLLDPTFIHDPPQVVAAGGQFGFLETVPNKATYFGWVTNAANLAWASNTDANGDNPGLNQGQIVAEVNQFQRLIGNIWARITRYVLPI